MRSNVWWWCLQSIWNGISIKPILKSILRTEISRRRRSVITPDFLCSNSVKNAAFCSFRKDNNWRIQSLSRGSFHVEIVLARPQRTCGSRKSSKCYVKRENRNSNRSYLRTSRIDIYFGMNETYWRCNIKKDITFTTFGKSAIFCLNFEFIYLHQQCWNIYSEELFNPR